MWDTNLRMIIEEQFWLSKKCNISILESNEMEEFERASYVNLLISNIKNESESFESLESLI